MLAGDGFRMRLGLFVLDIEAENAALQGAAGSGEVRVFRFHGMDAVRGLLRGRFSLMRTGSGCGMGFRSRLNFRGVS